MISIFQGKEGFFYEEKKCTGNDHGPVPVGAALLGSMGSGYAAGGFGGGGDVPPPPPGGGSMTFYTGDAVTDLESGDYTGQVFPDSTGETEVALRVGPGVTATLKDSTVTKTAGDMTGDDGSFYGVNSGVLAYSEDASTPAELTINGGKVETSASGANGVFAYGSSTINLEDATVTTTGEGGSGGIMVAGGGTLYAKNCTVTTEGGSSAGHSFGPRLRSHGNRRRHLYCKRLQGHWFSGGLLRGGYHRSQCHHAGKQCSGHLL